MKNQLALGHILALAVSAVWGTTYISTKVLLTAFHPVEILVFRFLLAWAVLFLCSPRPLLPKGFRRELPFLWGGGLSPDLARFAQPALLGNTLYLGIGASALCFLAWNKASALIGPVATNVYLYLMPVITVAASALILREPVTALTLGAIALILVGLALSQQKAPPESL